MAASMQVTSSSQLGCGEQQTLHNLIDILEGGVTRTTEYTLWGHYIWLDNYCGVVITNAKVQF